MLDVFQPTGYSGATLNYIPSKQSGTTNPTYTDLSSFATASALSNEAVIPLAVHKDTDIWRWQYQYDEIRKSIVRDAYSRGMKPDDMSMVVAPTPYTVDSTYGGIMEVTMKNTDTTTTQVMIGSTMVYDATGLPPNIIVRAYFEVENGNVVSVNNNELMTFTPFIADSESPFYQMVVQVTNNQNTIAKLQNDLLDFKASIDNKALDTDPSHVENILNSTYTVTNTLGGRLNGKGYVLLGLLGVKLVATGTVDVT